MITDNDKNILDRNDILLLRNRRLREFLYTILTDNVIRTRISMKETIHYNANGYFSITSKRISVSLPINFTKIDTDSKIDYLLQQLLEKLPDISSKTDISDFEYHEIIFEFSDYSSLYPSRLFSNAL